MRCRFSAMAERESAGMSSSSLSGVRERMQEKKKGALRTVKLNTSLASKIKRKIISKYNSSIMKVSLQQNNKALALALNAEKANVQRLTREKTILQKEVKQCHFQNAVLRHRLSFLNNTLKKMDNLMAAVRMAELSEFHTNSASLSSGQKSSMTEDSWADDVADGQLLRIGTRVPISNLHDAEQQAGSSTAVQTSSGELQTPASDAGELQRLASDEPLKIVPIASKDTVLPQHDGKLQFHQEENSKKVADTLATEEAFHDAHIFGAEVLHTTEENPNDLPALACESHPLSHEADEMEKHFFHLSQRNITQRRKRPTSVARSIPYFALEILACVSPTQAAWGTAAQDNSSSSKSNSKQQLRSPSPLASPAQTAIIAQRNSVGKETFCEQPQTKDMGCGAEMDPSYSQVPEFVPVKVKSQGNCKTGEKKSIKKARTGKEETTAIKNNAENNTGRPQGEECAQNAKKLLQPEVATCSSETGVCEMGQRTHEGPFDSKNRDCGVEQHSHSPAGVQDFGSTYEVNPAQLQSVESVDLMQKGKKVPMFETQSMESLLKSSVCTFLSHEVPSDDSSLQNPTEFSSESRKRAWIDVQDVANDSTKDLPYNLRQRRKTHIVHPLDLEGNSGCFQTEFEGGENAPPRSVPGSKGSKIPRLAKRIQKSNIKQIGGLQEKGQGEDHNNVNALKKEVSCKRSLFSHSLESSHVSTSGVLPVSSRLTEVSVSKSLRTEGKRMSAQSPVHLKNSWIVKKKTAEKIPGARNQVQSSSRSIPSKEPDIGPLQDLKNARALSRSGLEESSGRPSGQKWKPTRSKGPLINRKLRQGDPFTDRSSSTLLSTKENKKPVQAKAMTKKMNENQEGTPEECLGAKAMNA